MHSVYTGGKPFPRSLHEKLRIIGRTAERKKSIAIHKVSKRLLNSFFSENRLVFYLKKNPHNRYFILQ